MAQVPVLAALVALAVVPLAAAAENLQIQPGQWKIRTEVKNSMMPEPRIVTRNECVTDSEWDAEKLMEDAQGCTMSDVESSAEKLSWKVVCSGPSGRMSGKAVYLSSGDSVDGRMNMNLQATQMNLSMDMKFEGRRVGECETPPPTEPTPAN